MASKHHEYLLEYLDVKEEGNQSGDQTDVAIFIDVPQELLRNFIRGFRLLVIGE